MLTKSNTLGRRHDFVLRVARTGTLLAQLTPVGAGWSTKWRSRRYGRWMPPAPKTERAQEVPPWGPHQHDQPRHREVCGRSNDSSTARSLGSERCGQSRQCVGSLTAQVRPKL